MFSFKKMLSGKDRPLIMGILNVTPDSFSDGGEAFTIEAVIEKVNNLCEQGADIIDVGACSTAPMNATVTDAEEIKILKKAQKCQIQRHTNNKGGPGLAILLALLDHRTADIVDYNGGHH